MPVCFHELETVILKSRRKLKLFISTIFLKEQKILASLDIVFCSDEYLLVINKKHLNHNFYTDIITFDLSNTNKSPIIGELYISVDRIKENSNTNNVSFNNELHRVIFHGVLHLCGFKDKNKTDTAKIRRKENDYLSEYEL